MLVQFAQALYVSSHLPAHLVEDGGEQAHFVVAAQINLSAVRALSHRYSSLSQTTNGARDGSYHERYENKIRHERGHYAEDQIAPPSLCHSIRHSPAAEAPPDDGDLQ